MWYCIKLSVCFTDDREREMFYLTTHSTHFIYGYMASDIWLRTILIVRKEIAQWVHPMKDRSDDPPYHERTLYLWATSCSLLMKTIIYKKLYQSYILFQVSYGALTVQLSDTKQFPHFYRVYASDKILNIGRVALMKHFKWKKIWTLYDKTFELFSLVRYKSGLYISQRQVKSVLWEIQS